MNKKIYKLVVDTFHSHWFRIEYLIGFREKAVKELYFDKVTSLSELLDNFDNIKTYFLNIHIVLCLLYYFHQ